MSTGWEEGFSFLVFSLVFWFSFCGSALPCFVYQHQSWNQLCLFVDLSFPWNLWIFLGHSVFLIIKKVVHMATKERLGSKKPQTHRGPSVALPLAWMTGDKLDVLIQFGVLLSSRVKSPGSSVSKKGIQVEILLIILEQYPMTKISFFWSLEL